MFKQFPDIRSLLRGHFFAGLLVVIPLGVIVWIVGAALRWLWGFQRLLPESWRPEAAIPDSSLAFLVNLSFTLGIAVLLAFGISMLGWISKQYLGQKALDALGHLIQRIPVIRGVYSSLDQLLRTMASGGGKQFNRVVYVEYPRQGIWALAFVTGQARGPAVPEAHLNIYVPTTPNPTSGFHLIVPEKEVRDAHLTVEEAFKTILSLGIAQSQSSSEASGGRS